MSNTWSEAEVEASVKTYLEMLALERQGIPYVKSEFNAQLRTGALRGRTKASIEYRMQNISAVLEDLGLDRIRGYLPAKNVGRNVKEAVTKALLRQGMPSTVDREPTADREVLRSRTKRIKDWGLQNPPKGKESPNQTTTQRIEYTRDPAVQAWVLDTAEGH